jgi:hypothetical protein
MFISEKTYEMILVFESLGLFGFGYDVDAL